MSFLSTLASAFKGGGRERVPLARSFTSPWSFALEPRPFEYRSAVARAFVDNPVAQRAVRLVAEGIGSAPLAPADPTSDDRAALALVSATSAGQALLETLAAQILLHGNGYVQVVRDGAGKPVELFALRPDRVTVVAGEDGWPAGYKYTVGDKVMTLPLEDGDGWPSLVHLKAFHPADDHRRTGAERILRQRSARLGRCAAASCDRRHRRHAAGHAWGGRMLARRRRADRRVGRPRRAPRRMASRGLDLCPPTRRDVPPRPFDRAGHPVHRRLAAPHPAGNAIRRDDRRFRSASRDRRPRRRACDWRILRRQLTSGANIRFVRWTGEHIRRTS